jgi:hypothetical protein
VAPPPYANASAGSGANVESQVKALAQALIALQGVGCNLFKECNCEGIFLSFPFSSYCGRLYFKFRFTGKEWDFEI